MAVYSLKYIYIVLKVYMLVGSLQQINIAQHARVCVCIPYRDIKLLHASVAIAMHTHTYIYCIYNSTKVRGTTVRISCFSSRLSLSIN